MRENNDVFPSILVINWCMVLYTNFSTYLIADSLFLVASVICTGRVLEEREESPVRE